MARGRPKAALVLSEDERAQLASFARSRSLPSALSSRARIILASADGEVNSAIASRLQLNPGTVRKWRTQFHRAAYRWVVQRGAHRQTPFECCAR